jgi:Tol biopolymer transport system component/DNA-binding winged helix-turn-helix (wHTH) protein
VESIHHTSPRIRFGVFEVDLQTEELYKSGMRVKIQNQPFKVLSLMLERPGEIVSRDEMQRRLWGDQTTVDFDHSLGTAMNKLREALGDSADNPRFIETMARRGYRFIAPIRADAEPPAPKPFLATPLASQTQAPAPATLPPARRQWHHWAFLGPVGAALLLMAGGLLLWRSAVANTFQTPFRISQVTYSGRVFPGEPLQENLGAMATDGSRIYFLQIENGREELMQALIADGETSLLPVPSEIAAPSLGDISADGSQLVVRNYLIPEAEQPLWILPTLGGTARSFSNIEAHDATVMPDGKRMLYANGTDLYIANEDGTGSRKFAAVPGRAFWLRWSPDGSELRFTLIDSLNHTTSLWEIGSDGKNLRPLFPDWSHPSSECCGSWTADGKYFVFQSAHNGLNNIWVLTKKSWLSFGEAKPIQITNGPLSYQAPITANTGHRLFFIGKDSRSMLLRLDAMSKQFVPYGRMLSAAQLVDFSRNGESVAWINPEDSSLWSSRVDGSQRLQLTSSPMEVFMMHWSPDGKRIVLMAREPGKVWRIYTMDAQGGNLKPVLQEARNEADPSWSADGNSIAFGRLPELMAEKSLPKSIYILNLTTKQLTTVPNSEGLFSPRWSPDGRYIVAMSLDQSKLMLYDVASQSWKTLISRPAHDPVWSHDSHWIYFDDFVAKDQPVYRISVPGGQLEQVAGLESVQPADALDFRFAGLTPQDVPLVNARISTANIYSMSLGEK